MRLISRPSIIPLVTIGAAVLTAAPAQSRQVAAPPAAAAGTAVKPEALEPTRIKNLDATTDGVELAAWHYPAPESAPPMATVILIHDLGGSHRTVDPLARALQAAGCTVISPDLRGHGDSKLSHPAVGDPDPTKALKRPDLEMIAASRDGRMRDQAGVRGDIECLRTWIKRGVDAGKLPRAPLFIVGSGLGAMLGSAWTIADASWPDIASGPQGREVAGVVMISPPFVEKGIQFSPMLSSEAIGRSVPILVIAGRADRDASKVFDVLKRQRPDAWFDSRVPPGNDRGASPVGADDASLLMFTGQADRSGDALAASRAARGDPASLILAFVKIVNDRAS
jgi:alpha-beta hydrolase superfamily lysophospholipase